MHPRVQVVSGPAIAVPTPKVIGAKPDEALVDEYLEKYKAALIDLFERHKGPLGFGDRTLHIV